MKEGGGENTGVVNPLAGGGTGLLPGKMFYKIDLRKNV